MRSPGVRWSFRVGLLGLLAAVRLAAGTAAVTIDFDAMQTTLSPLAFSLCASGYGANGTQLPRQPAQVERIAALQIAMMRINLGYRTAGDPASGIICLAGGADGTLTGDEWIDAIRRAGALPEVRVQMNAAQTPAVWAADAANLVRYFNLTTGNRVERWVIGNEPDGKRGLGLSAYTEGFIAMFKAMKEVDPAIAIGGPATAAYQADEAGFLKTFLRHLHAAGITPDFVDFHSYGTGTHPIADDALLAIAKKKYADEPADLRRYLISLWGPAVGEAIPIELGEWNLSWRSDPRQLQHFASVWSALALSHMVKAGLITRLYADKNGPLGAVSEVVNPSTGGVTYPAAINDPQPVYHGIGMFTGESLFPAFGREVVKAEVVSSTGLVSVVASRAPWNIVAVNSSPDDETAVTFNLSGVGDVTVSIWQKNAENRGVVSLGSIPARGGSFGYALKPYTVTTFVVTPWQ